MYIYPMSSKGQIRKVGGKIPHQEGESTKPDVRFPEAGSLASRPGGSRGKGRGGLSKSKWSTVTSKVQGSKVHSARVTSTVVARNRFPLRREIRSKSTGSEPNPNNRPLSRGGLGKIMKKQQPSTGNQQQTFF